MQEPNKNDFVTFYYQANSVISYSNAVVSVTASELPEVIYLLKSLCFFNEFYSFSDSF